VDAGFDAGDVVWLHVILPERYESEARLLFFQTLRERLAVLPGVVAAGAIHGLPLDGNRSITSVEPEGAAGVPDELPRVPFHSITPDYFRSLGIDLAAGRDFTSADRADSPPVAIVSAAFAQRHWPGEAAVGKRVRLGPADRPSLTVVGVAGDVRHYGLAQDIEPMLYLPLAQYGRGNVTFALRHDGRDPAALLVAMRTAVWSLDSTLPLDRFGTMASHVRTSLVQPRFYTALLAGFGGVAVILAFVGLYGTLAYTVRTRSRELGIRVALGAAGHDLRRLIVRHGMRLAFAGIALGVAGAFAAARMLGTFVHGVAPTDPATYAAVVGGMVLVALAACWLPARRAARLDPVRTLRGD
jgi:predicted permease